MTFADEMRRIIIQLALCALVAGCTKPKEIDRTEVRSRLRLKSTPIAVPESGIIRFRVTPGKNATMLWPQRVSIRHGAITFHGTNGYVRLTTNNTTVIKSGSLDHEVAVQMMPGTQHVRFHLSSIPFSMSINWSTEPSLTQYCESNKCSYSDFCPLLTTVTNGSSFDVHIPVEMTGDFQGEVTDWVIQSNWK